MIIGIDLGTTNSAVSVYKDEKMILIPNSLGETLTPSVVSMGENGEFFVGRVAQERLVTFPTRSFANFKRTMGTAKKYILDQHEYTSAELSSLILKSLVSDAETYLGQKCSDAIISVPAYFNNTQRQDTLFAAKLAGLNIKRLVNEPTAAALAHGMVDQDDGNTLVFDLGGGTCDISIIEKFEELLEIHASIGNNFLGGTDFTQLIFNRLAQQLANHHGVDLKGLSQKQLAILSLQAEKVKIALSQNAQVSLDVRLNERTFNLQINASEFESDTLPLQNKIIHLLERALRDAKLMPSDLSRVILVGGASRMPLIKKLIARHLGLLPLCHLNPDEVVCMGTSYLSVILEKRPHVRDRVVTDVTPYSMGVAVLDTQLGSKHFSPILDRNTTVPCSREDIYRPIYSDQKILELEIYQGESRRLEDNVKIGTLQVEVSHKPATEATFSVRFTYDNNGVLEVTVTSLQTKKVQQSFFKQGELELSDAEVKKIFEKLSSLKIHPRQQEPNLLLLERLNCSYEESLGDLRKDINLAIRDFEVLLETQNNELIEAQRLRLEKFLDERNF